MIIDAHGHVGTWWAFAIPDSSTESLVRVMDRCGVTTMCVSHLLAIGPDSRAGNALLLDELQRYPDRLLGYAVFDPHDPEAMHRAADLVAVPGVIGLKLHPDTHEYALDWPGYDAAFELAAARDCVVLAHGMFGSRLCGPEQFAAVAARYPSVKLLMGHAGLMPAGYPAAAEVAAQHPNVTLEICGSRMTARHIAWLVKEVGAHRMVYGSDALFLDLRVGLGRVQLAPISQADRDQLLSGTMTRLLQGLR